MFRENVRKLGIFNREYLIFFNQKCFLVEINILNWKKIEKKTFPKKWMGPHGFTHYLYLSQPCLSEGALSFKMIYLTAKKNLIKETSFQCWRQCLISKKITQLFLFLLGLSHLWPSEENGHWSVGYYVYIFAKKMRQQKLKKWQFEDR